MHKTKIVVCTDAHANLPAVRAMKRAAAGEGADAWYHLGDALNIGPFPAETLEELLGIPGIHFVRGNHENYLSGRIPLERAQGAEQSEFEHVDWTRSQLTSAMLDTIEAWPEVLEENICGVRTAFLHYAVDPVTRDFCRLIPHPTAEDLDRLFGSIHVELLFYGHDHCAADLTGLARYLNPGSLGAGFTSEAAYLVAEFGSGTLSIVRKTASYDREELLTALELRKVPARDTIRRIFYGVMP